MKLLLIDGNSIINRAFYGIKLLTTKDGRFTNGIFGFLNIFTKLCDDLKPEGVAVAFDLKGPTFRHELYDGYKANRTGMPPELAEQMPVLKELLTELGVKCVELEGYEADDIIGTLSAACQEKDECFIATGDRDTFQLVKDNVTVILPSTKMGRTTVTYYTPELIKEKYGIEPIQMIEIKALQGDSSDCIPGVAGVGEKTAGDLIQRFGNIDYIYENLETLDIKEGVRQKLEKDKDKAYLSKTLGTIHLEVPVSTDLSKYKVGRGDKAAASKILQGLEMFKMIESLGLDKPDLDEKNGTEAEKNTSVKPYHFTDDNKLYISSIDEADFAELESALKDRKIRKYVVDSKAIYSFAEKNNFEVLNIVFDSSLAAYILNPSAKDYSLERLLLEYSAGNFEVLSSKLIARIDENNQADLLALEISLAEVLASMESIGFLIDTKGLREYGKVIEASVEEITQRIYDQSGFEFNLNSPKQLGEVLFEKLGLPPKKKTKTGYSTAADVLEELAVDYPIVEDILEYRTVAKLKSTYCDGLLTAVSKDSRIRSTFNQTETRTGRLSSTEPNLQNIPVRKPLGSELRKFFIAKEGYVLIDADYSQIELRVLAHMSNDEKMIAAFMSGADIHRITASQVFGVTPETVTDIMRTRAKAVNFGIIYGMGAFSLAKDIGVTRVEAADYIKRYLENFSGVDKYMKNVIAKAKEDGYVKTLYERRRYLPELTSSNHMMRSFGERVARNMPIQGTAADIIKIAMVKVHNRLRAEKLDAKLIMQVHDELIIEARVDIAEKVSKIVKEEMENAVTLKVKLLSEANIGKTWYEAKG
ncbi:MAG: DNA polymerase I [Ruminococcaceae bacterium]|nr:DNA polymerase I [Oscillospiraceae bacterium]